MTLDEKLSTVDEQLLAGKTAIADALLQVGITAVEPNPNNPDAYEVFQSYADKIKRLMISNSLILEYVIPESATTTYKRTVVLPLSYNLDMTMVSGTRIANSDALALRLIASDSGGTSSVTAAPFSTLADGQSETATDAFGNRCVNGDAPLREPAEPSWQPDSPALLAEGDELPDYSYTVDWGDGSEPCEFVDYESTPEAWWHTYEKPGTYDVSINGLFRAIANNPQQRGRLMVAGEYVYDVDGEPVQANCNYAGSYCLKKVIAWGNTRLRTLAGAFTSCYQLNHIPTYDTTESFKDVESLESVFFSCFSLSSLPYDSNTRRGLFSNCPKVTNISSAFRGCTGLSGELPPLLFDGCGNVTLAVQTFYNCRYLSGTVPAEMFKGMSALTSTVEMFLNTQIGGPIPEGLFDDCVNLAHTTLMFSGTNVSGVVPASMFRNCAKLIHCEAMFNLCVGITGVEVGLFDNVTSSSLSCDAMFCDSGVETVPEGLLGGLRNKTKATAVSMFYNCPVSAAPATIVEEASGFKDVRDMFGHCVKLSSPAPAAPSNGDWDDPDKIWKYYSMFGGCSGMTGRDALPKEVGGSGQRKFPERNVGKIVLSDQSMTEISDFAYDETNKPVGLCFWSDDTADYVMALNMLDEALYERQYEELFLNHPSLSGATADKYGAMVGQEFADLYYGWNEYTFDKSRFPLWHAAESYLSDNPDNVWHIGNMAETHASSVVGGLFNQMRDRFVELGMEDFGTDTVYFYPSANNTLFWCSENDLTQYSIPIHDEYSVNAGWITCYARPILTLSKP